MAVSDYSTTPASNTSISGINVAEGCSPANINNAIRQLMADVKAFYNAAQPLDAALTSIAGLTTAADRMIYTTAADTYAVTTLTAAGRALLDDADAAAQLVTLGAQPLEATLTSLSGLTLAAGDLLYATAADTLVNLAKGSEGRSLVAGATAPEWASGISLQTAVAAAAQTSIPFTGIPSWVNRVNVHFTGFSTSGTSPVMVQLGDSGGLENTGYVGTSSAVGNGVGTAASTLSAGFTIDMGSEDTAAAVRHGSMTLQRVTGNVWVCASVVGLGNTGTPTISTTGGRKQLTDTLTQIAVTTVGGTDTFDAGSVSVSWE